MTSESPELGPVLESIRDTYSLVAADYTDLLRDNLAGKPADRAMLALFADLVRAEVGDRGTAGGEAGDPAIGSVAVGPVADIGCGPGRITPYLAKLGLDVFGIDLSPGMIEVARREHPELRFEVGTMTALNLETASLAGALGWYSLIHLPDELVPIALAEFRRVIRAGGYLMLAFQEGERIRHIDAAYGHEISLDLYRRSTAEVEAQLSAAGFTVFSSMVVAPVGWERESQAYVIARAIETAGGER